MPVWLDEDTGSSKLKKTEKELKASDPING